MRPAMRHQNGCAALAGTFVKPIVAGVAADHLEDAIKAGKENTWSWRSFDEPVPWCFLPSLKKDRTINP